MQIILIALLLAYFAVGILIYLFTDTAQFVGKLERMSLFITYADINKHMFPFVVILWPLWLYINATCND